MFSSVWVYHHSVGVCGRSRVEDALQLTMAILGSVGCLLKNQNWTSLGKKKQMLFCPLYISLYASPCQCWVWIWTNINKRVSQKVDVFLLRKKKGISILAKNIRNGLDREVKYSEFYSQFPQGTLFLTIHIMCCFCCSVQVLLVGIHSEK